MPVSSLLALLSLLTIHLQFISSMPNLTPTSPIVIPMPALHNPLEQGPGPQVYPPTPPLGPMVFGWDRELPIDKGSVTVTNLLTGHSAYTISQSPSDDRTTIISNLSGKELLSVKLTKKAHYGFTHSGVHYEIDPRGVATDRWYMTIEGNGRDVSDEVLEYFRGSLKNTGGVYYQRNHTRAASLKFAHPSDNSEWKSGALKVGQNIVTLEIPNPSDIGDHYFIGLWCVVKRRIDQYRV